MVPVAADVRKPSTLLPIVQGARAVINLVGILAPRGSLTFQAVHVEGTTTVATAAAAVQAEHFVQVSAIGADPASDLHYARTKGLAEARAFERFAAASVLRPSTVFGPDDQFFNRFAALIRMAPVMPVPDGGEMELQPVYVDDVAEAVFLAATTPDARGRTFELGGPNTYSLMQILRWTRGQISRKCMLLPVPRSLLWGPAMMMEMLPYPPVTREQLRLLGLGSVVSEDAETFDQLGIKPAAFEGIVPLYLERFRPGGDSLS